MRNSNLWSAIKLDGDVFIEGFLGLKWFPSAEAKAARDRWEAEVDLIVTRLSGKQSSWAVLKALSDSGRTITIVPEREKDCNSTTYPDSAQHAARKNVAAEHCSDAVTGSNQGTGVGTNSKITFSPAHWLKNGCSAGGAGRDGDEILLHEICHAMRYAVGQRNSCFETIAGFGDYEEFVAITLTNVFSSETGRTLRKDHEGFMPLPKLSKLFNNKGTKVEVDLHDPQKFCNWFRPQMENVQRYQPKLVTHLKGYRSIKWNPFLYI